MKILITILFFVCLIGGVNASEVIDDIGQKIKLNQPAKRIISLAPDLTEILFEIGAGEKIVGVMAGSDYPEKAKRIPVVASYNSIDAEKILALHPDLILVWSQGKMVSTIKKWNIPVYVSHPKKITDVPNTFRKLGSLTGMEALADKKAAQFAQRYQALKRKYSNNKNISVFYQVWPQPLLTISSSSWINDAIIICGGNNIFANLRGPVSQVDIEAVLTANPSVIIGPKTLIDWKKFWLKWPKLAAVQNKQLFSIHPDLIERAGPRLLDGVEEICKLIANSNNTNLKSEIKRAIT